MEAPPGSERRRQVASWRQVQSTGTECRSFRKGVGNLRCPVDELAASSPGGHRWQRLSGRSVDRQATSSGAGRANAKNLASLVQVGPPVNGQWAGPGGPSRDPGRPEPAVYGRCSPGRGGDPDTQRFARPREEARGARS